MSTTSVAKAFWISSATQPLLAYTNLSAAFEIAQQYPDEVDQANDALAQDLTQRGLATDLVALTSQYDAVKSGSTAFWTGLYLVQAATGELLQLSVGRDTLSMTDPATSTVLMSVDASKATMAAQVLSYEDEAVKFSCRFFFPSDLLQDGTSPVTQLDSDEARVADGLLQQKTAGGATFAFSGKRGVFTLEGLQSHTFGDPLDVWLGSYVWRYTNDDCAYLDDLTIATAADGSVSVNVGETAAVSAMLRNNVLVFSLPDGSSVAANLACASTGVRTLSGVRRAAGLERPVAGTAQDLYESGAAQLAAPVASALNAEAPTDDTPPDVCTTDVDQVLSMKSALGALTVLTPDPQWATLSTGDGNTTVQITPLVGTNGYALPRGSFAGYIPKGTNGPWQLAWLAGTRITLPEMVERDYYQLRLSFTDWDFFDKAGIDIALQADDPKLPGLIAFKTPTASTCPVGSGGGDSQIADFTKATTFLYEARPSPDRGGCEYRLKLKGKSKPGFFQASVLYNQWLPPKVMDVVMLVQARMAIYILPEVTVKGAQTMPNMYVGQPYRARLAATGGLVPYEWSPADDGSLPDGLEWSVAETDHNGGTFVLQGTPSGIEAGTTISTWVTVQANRNTGVTQRRRIPVNIAVKNTLQQSPAPFAAIVGGALAAGGVILALLGVGLYAWRNRSKVDTDAMNDYEMVDLSAHLDVAKSSGSSVGSMQKSIWSFFRKDASVNAGGLAKSLNDAQLSMSALVEKVARIKKALPRTTDETKRRQLLSEWDSVKANMLSLQSYMERLDDDTSLVEENEGISGSESE
jgi:hypothetical protein